MFEIVCEVANTSGKTLTIETSIPEAEKPDVQILKSGQQMGVFASQTGSTVKITVVSVEATDRIEKLEAVLQRANATVEEYERKFYLGTDRIEKLEAALRLYACESTCPNCYGQVQDTRYCGWTARKALEGKDDVN